MDQGIVRREASRIKKNIDKLRDKMAAINARTRQKIEKIHADQARKRLLLERERDKLIAALNNIQAECKCQSPDVRVFGICPNCGCYWPGGRADGRQAHS